MTGRMQAFVAVTENDWFRFVSAQEGLGEVNLSRPGGSLTLGALLH